MKVSEDIKLDFQDVLLRPKRSTLESRKDVCLEREFHFRHSGRKWKGIPIMVANMDTVGTFEMHTALAPHKMITCLHKFYSVDDFEKWAPQLKPDYFALSTGIKDHDWEKLLKIMELVTCHFICIDVANGYTQRFVDFTRKCRKRFPTVTLIAGNVCTREMVEELSINGGIDIVKVGIGNGSVCTTRLQTGVGYPQLSAVFECSDAAHGVDTCIISDGGVRCPGDVAKALCGGADFVMSGSLFAGHTECNGKVTWDDNGSAWMHYYGMSSQTAQEKYHGGVASHRSAEGKTVRVHYRGDVESTVLDILGGLRSACTYIGARGLKHMGKCASFVRVRHQVNDLFETSS